MAHGKLLQNSVTTTIVTAAATTAVASSFVTCKKENLWSFLGLFKLIYGNTIHKTPYTDGTMRMKRNLTIIS